MADTTEETAPDTWTTAEAVLALTGVTVDAKAIVQARSIIEVKTGVLMEQFPLLWGRDRVWLARAVGYQAAYMSEHPDLFSLVDASSIGQDGQSMSGVGAWLTLAPLAKATLRRLSWKGSHSTRALAPGEVAPGNDLDETDRHGRPLRYEPLS